MRRLLVILGFLIVGAAAHAQTPALQWSASCPNSGPIIGAFSTTPDYQCPLAEPSVAGDSLVVRFCYDNTSNNQVFVISDEKSDVFSLIVTSATGNGKQCQVYVAANVLAGTRWVKLHKTSGGSNGYWQVTWAEYYNVAASSVVDASSCNATNSATLTAGSITPSVTGDLLDQFTYASNYNGQASFTVGSQANISWAFLFEGLGDGAAAQYGVYNSTAAINPTFTQPSANFFISCVVALKAGSSGSASTQLPRTLHLEVDGMQKVAPNPWKIGMVSTVGSQGAVYLTYLDNDAPSASNPITSIPAPTVGWTASGTDGAGQNGHNHSDIYAASFSSAPNTFSISVSRVSNSNDAIYVLRDVLGGTTTLESDSGQSGGILTLSGNQTTLVSTLTFCSSCLTPTHQNDIVIGNYGQGFCTVGSLNAPASGIDDAPYFTGTTIDGPSQVGENNGFFYYLNGTSTSALTVTFGEICGSNAEAFWAGRIAIYQSTAGSCPAGNVINDQNGNPVTLASEGVTTCYYISSATGSDSNSGLDEAHAWAHLPGMPSCTGLCSSTASAASTGYILRGGDSWLHTDLGVNWAHSGTSGHVQYIGGGDPTWFNASCGASWCRPIFNGEKVAFTNAGYVMQTLNDSFLHVDNIEIIGMTNADAGIACDFVCTNQRFSRLYFHGWGYITATGNNFGMFYKGNGQANLIADHNVIDGSDSTVPTSTGSCASSGATLCGTQNGFIQGWTTIEYNVIQYVVSGVLEQGYDSVHDNLVLHSVSSPDGDHCNGIFTGAPSTGLNLLVYNNVLSNGIACSGGVPLWFNRDGPNASYITYAFNNVEFDVSSNPVNIGQANGTYGTTYWFNNTVNCTLGGCGGSVPAGKIYTFYDNNNHVMPSALNFDTSGSGGTTPVCNLGAGVGCTDLTQSNATANGQGYTSAETLAYSPINTCTSGTCGTVQNGTNLQSYCTALSSIDAAAGLACQSSTTYAISYNTSNHTVTGPVATPIARPASTVWDIGAYQLSSSLPPPGSAAQNGVKFSNGAILQ